MLVKRTSWLFHGGRFRESAVVQRGRKSVAIYRARKVCLSQNRDGKATFDFEIESFLRNLTYRKTYNGVILFHVYFIVLEIFFPFTVIFSQIDTLTEERNFRVKYLFVFYRKKIYLIVMT